MEKSYETVKVGKGEIEIQVLSSTLILTVDGKERDLTIMEAYELYEKLGKLMPRITIQNEPTHNT